MLPVQCHGLMYTPRLLALMLLLARHLRLIETGRPLRATRAVCAASCSDDAAAQAAGAVYKGLDQERSDSSPCLLGRVDMPAWSTMSANATDEPSTRSEHAVGRAHAVEQDMEGSADLSLVSDFSEGAKRRSAGTAQLGVCSAYSLDRQRVRTELMRLQQMGCDQASDPVGTLSKLQCSPEVPASPYMHRASATTLSSLPMHEGLAPLSSPTSRRCSIHHAVPAPGSPVVHGSAPRVSHINAQGITFMHATFDHIEDSKGPEVGQASLQKLGSLCSSSAAPCPSEETFKQLPAQFQSTQTLSCDADGGTDRCNQERQGAGSRTVSSCSGGRATVARWAPRTGTPFAIAWDKVRNTFSCLMQAHACAWP